MSIAIQLKKIPKTNQIEIAELLTFTPSVNSNQTYSDYNVEEKPSFSVFKSITIDEVKYALLPLYFGNLYLANYELDIPRLCVPIDATTEPYRFTGSLREYQQHAVDLARSHLKEHQTSTISLHAGAGKTVTSIATFATYSGITGIIIHMETLIDQWCETCKQFTDAKYHVFGRKENVFTLEESNVWIIMEKRIKKLVELNMINNIKNIIVDEAHHFCTPSRSHALLNLRPDYLIMVTATPLRDDGLHQIMHAFVGTHQILKPYQVEFEVHRIRTGIKPTKESNSRGDLNFTVFSQSLMYHLHRNLYVTSLVEMNRSRKILILTKEKEHVDILAKMIESRGIQVATMRGNDKKYSDKSVLIGTVSKIGCGFDEATFANAYNGKRLDLLIFLASYKNKATIEQSVGRVLRSESPVIIYLNDEDGICDNHWRIFRDWCEDNNGVCHSYRTSIERASSDLEEHFKSKAPKVIVKKKDITLWNEKWIDVFESIKERRRRT